jgi:hypothetical protein
VELVTALAPPVRVSLDCSAPAAVRLAAPQVPVIPAGRPVTLKVAVEALDARETPPTGATVTVIEVVAIESMLMDEGARVAAIAGAAVTCTLAVVEAVSPSPVAVILKLVVASVAAVEGLRVSVEVVAPSAVEV